MWWRSKASAVAAVWSRSPGIAGGLSLGYALPRPKVLLAAVVLLPAIAIGLLRVPPIQERALNAVRSWAIYHAGHVGSPGYSYRILDGRYYIDSRRIFGMPGDEAVAYVLRSYVSYVTEPVPWRIESRTTLAYVPEQMFWSCCWRWRRSELPPARAAMRC